MIEYYHEKLNAKIRVFISSTFRDMQPERNAIVNGVFPYLRRSYKKRSVDIMEVDLRWGISESDISNMALLEICIEETLNCVPYFIGIIGDNYGTLAKLEEIKNLPNSYKKAIGMRSREDIPVGVSLTELEMRAGAFVKNNKQYSRFFIRKGKNGGSENLEKLKKKVVDEGFEYCTYESLAEFERLVYEQLRNLIDENMPSELTPPYRDRHYFSHLRLLKRENSSHIPNERFIEDFERRLNRSRCLYLYGEKGSGKTSALAHLICREGILRDGDVFFHFADADEESLNLDNLYNRLRRFLESKFEITSTDGNHYNAIIEILKTVRPEKRIVLFFDAIEKYSDNSILNKLFLLAKFNDRVCVCCSGAKEYKCVTEGETITVVPLDNEQIRQMTVRSLSNYGKKLAEPMMEALMENDCCKNPLYLTVLLSQLVSYGNHDSFQSFFFSLISKKSFDELFFVVAERLATNFEERNFGRDKVYLALALIAYSNMGIKESELNDIVGFLPIARSIFISALELFISEADCSIKFTHDLIIQACRDFLMEKADYEAMARAAIIAYFEKDSSSIRAYSELPYQYDCLGMNEKIKALLLDKECFCYLAKNQFNNLIRYLMSQINDQKDFIPSVIEKVEMSDAPLIARIFCYADCYRAAIAMICRAVGAEISDHDATYRASSPDVLADLIEGSGYSDLVKVRLFAVLSRSYYKLAINHYANAERAYLRAVAFYKKAYPDDEVGFVTQSYLLGVTYKSMGNLTLAGEYLRHCAEVYIRYGIKNDTASWILAVTGNLFFAMGDISAARAYLKQSADDNLFLFGDRSQEYAWSNSYGWPVYYDNGEKKTAYKMTKSAFSTYDELYHSRGAKVAWAASNIAACEHMQGDYPSAKKHYLLSIHENDGVLPEAERPHTYSLTTYTNLAILLYDEKKLEESKQCIEFTRRLTIDRNGPRHIYTGNILLVEGIIKNSPEIVADAVSIFEENATPDIYFALNCYARVLFAAGRDGEADDVATALYKRYNEQGRKMDLLTYLTNETYEKLAWDAENAETAKMKDTLAIFKDYRYYVPLNNGSALIMIPRI